MQLTFAVAIISVASTFARGIAQEQIAPAVNPVPAPPMGSGLLDIGPRNVGPYSCKSVTDAVATKNATGVDRLRIMLGVDEWFAGYLNALNDRMPKAKRIPPEDLAIQSFGFLMGYCGTNPTNTVSDAAAAWAQQNQ